MLMSMSYSNPKIANLAEVLTRRLAETEDKSSVLKSQELKALYAEIPLLPAEERADFGRQLNELKVELVRLCEEAGKPSATLLPIDITAPFDVNTTDSRPCLLPATNGSMHPLMSEMDKVIGIYNQMGFEAIESRQIDDDFHMFEALNFPPEHPARDDYDTFMTEEGLIAPAHTSTMQHRVLKKYKTNLDMSDAIKVVIPGRVFRNEDLDARHEHTFYQLEGIYVGRGIHVGHLLATLKTFLQAYYQKELPIKTQPFYFPFTEPSFEFALGCPFCGAKGCNICSKTGWIELLGCGLIHPNVLKKAGIDPTEYTGFAWGGGIDRLVMMKSQIEDIRHFHSGKLAFLRQF